MRQLIIQLLVLNIVFSNLAWAMDNCAYNFTMDAGADIEQINSQSTNTADEQLNNTADSDNEQCDNYCFANARLIYMSFALNDISSYDKNGNIVNLQNFFYSLKIQPPNKPPRV